MKTITSFLFEAGLALDKKLHDVETDQHGRDRYTRANFEVDGKKFQVSALVSPEFGKDVAEIEFSRVDAWPRYGIVGDLGVKAVTVMSHVASAITQLLKLHPKIDVLVFTADEPSRQKLYMRFFAMMGKKMGWYGVTTVTESLGKKFFVALNARAAHRIQLMAKGGELDWVSTEK
jgi:hypothetical protein